MKQMLKKIFEGTPMYHPLRNWIQARNQKKKLIKWENDGKPVPPPHIVKQRTIRKYAERFGIRIFIETGTYYGDMVYAMKDCFDQLYSIELSKELYNLANKRFSNDRNVAIIHGDSGVELGKLVERITEPALFWLDGHYSGGITANGEGDTPIYKELIHIFNANRSKDVIIIDDARYFGNDPSYPTLEKLADFVIKFRPDANIEVKHDSIRITPSNING